MTTPENIRRRQLVQGVILVALGLATILMAAYFQGRNDAILNCFQNYVSTQGEATRVRSIAIDEESKATREVITSALSADSPAQLDRAREDYFQHLEKIDALRKNNPVPVYQNECQ